MAKLYTCKKCGTQEEPPKFAREKAFLCKECSKNEEEIEKICNDEGEVKEAEIVAYLESKDFVLSKTGIPYKSYDNIRISLSNICGVPALMVKDKYDNMCYTDRSIVYHIPKEAIMDLKKVINTIDKLWQK